MTDSHLINNIPNFILHFLLRAQKPLPQIIAHASALEQHRKSLLLATESHDAPNVFAGAAEERRLEY